MGAAVFSKPTNLLRVFLGLHPKKIGFPAGGRSLIASQFPGPEGGDPPFERTRETPLSLGLNFPSFGKGPLPPGVSRKRGVNFSRDPSTQYLHGSIASPLSPKDDFETPGRSFGGLKDKLSYPLGVLGFYPIWLGDGFSRGEENFPFMGKTPRILFKPGDWPFCLTPVFQGVFSLFSRRPNNRGKNIQSSAPWPAPKTPQRGKGASGFFSPLGGFF